MADLEYQRANDGHIAEIKAAVSELKVDVAEIKANAANATTVAATLHGDVQEVKTSLSTVQAWVEDNAAVSRDIKEILTSFKFIGSISKWLAVVLASVATTYAAIKGWASK
jgi:uncharacterized protein YoxC